MADPASTSFAPDGLAMSQLLKLKARGLLSLQQFLEMTSELAGSDPRSDPERPICYDRFETSRRLMWGCWAGSIINNCSNH